MFRVISVERFSVYNSDGLASMSLARLAGANNRSTALSYCFQVPSAAISTPAVTDFASDSVARIRTRADATLMSSSLKRKIDKSTALRSWPIAVSSSSLSAIDHRVPGFAESAIWIPYQRWCRGCKFEKSSRNVRKRMMYFSLSVVALIRSTGFSTAGSRSRPPRPCHGARLRRIALIRVLAFTHTVDHQKTPGGCSNHYNLVTYQKPMAFARNLVGGWH